MQVSERVRSVALGTTQRTRRPDQPFGATRSLKAHRSELDRRGLPFLSRQGLAIVRRVSLMPGETESLTLPAAAAFSGLSQARALFRATAVLVGPPVG